MRKLLYSISFLFLSFITFGQVVPHKIKVLSSGATIDSSFVNSKLAKADTAAMLNPYVRKSDANITGLIIQGTGTTLTGNGTSSSPYIINSIGGGGGSSNYDTVYSISALKAYSGTPFMLTVIDSLQGGTFAYTIASLSANNGTIFSATGRGSGYWVRQYDKAKGVDVDWLGARTEVSINAAQAIAGANGTINFTPNKLYTLSDKVFPLSGVTFNGNNATLKRSNGTMTTTTVNASTSQPTITVSSIPSGWKVGSLIYLYYDTTAFSASVGLIISSISGNNITFSQNIGGIYTVNPSHPQITTWPSGTSVMRAFNMIDDGDISVNFKLKNLIFDGNKDNNKFNYSWVINTTILAHGIGGLLSIDNCQFYNSPNETITGHGFHITNNYAKNINGSFVHLSEIYNKVPAQLPSIISGNVTDSTNLVPDSITAHSQGVITYSYTSGYNNITNNRFTNGKDAVFGLIHGGTDIYNGGVRNMIITNNYAKNFNGIFYTLGGGLENGFSSPSGHIYISDNMFDACKTTDWTDYQSVLDSYDSIIVGNNMLVGGTVWTLPILKSDGTQRYILNNSTVNPQGGSIYVGGNVTSVHDITSDSGRIEATNGSIISGNSTAINNYIQVSGSPTDNTFTVLNLSRKWPKINLNDNSTGGSYFSIWNLANQVRIGTNTANEELSSININGGDKGDVTINGNLILPNSPVGSAGVDSIVVKGADNKLKVISPSSGGVGDYIINNTTPTPQVGTIFVKSGITSDSGNIEATNGKITSGNIAAINNYVQITGSSTDNTFLGLKITRKWPQIALNDNSTGGSIFTIWNLVNQIRIGTNTSSEDLSAMNIYSGDKGDVNFNGSIILAYPLTGSPGTDSLLVRGADNKIKVISPTYPINDAVSSSLSTFSSDKINSIIASAGVSSGLTKLGVSNFGLIKPNDSTYVVDSSEVATVNYAAPKVNPIFQGVLSTPQFIVTESGYSNAPIIQGRSPSMFYNKIDSTVGGIFSTPIIKYSVTNKTGYTKLFGDFGVYGNTNLGGSPYINWLYIGVDSNADYTHNNIRFYPDKTTALMQVNNGVGDFVTINTSNGLITRRTASETLNDIGAQVPLVSGTNIKTINGNSILGVGNISISGGGISKILPGFGQSSKTDSSTNNDTTIMATVNYAAPKVNPVFSGVLSTPQFIVTQSGYSNGSIIQGRNPSLTFNKIDSTTGGLFIASIMNYSATNRTNHTKLLGDIGIYGDMNLGGSSAVNWMYISVDSNADYTHANIRFYPDKTTALMQVNNGSGDFITRNLSTGLITRRTAAETLSDIGAASTSSVAGKLNISDTAAMWAAHPVGGSYTLPTATTSVLGGIKVGTGLTISSGVLSAIGGSSTDTTSLSARINAKADTGKYVFKTVTPIKVNNVDSSLFLEKDSMPNLLSQADTSLMSANAKSLVSNGWATARINTKANINNPTFTTSITTPKLKGSGTPTVAIGTSFTGTVTVSGNDVAGEVSVVITGSASYPTNAELFTLTYGTAYSTMPYVVYSTSSSSDKNLGGTYLKASGTSSFQVAVYDAGASITLTAYKFTYHAIQ